MTGKAKPSEAKASESELSISVIPVGESKEDEKTLILFILLEELVVGSEEDKQITGNNEVVKKKVVEIASDKGAKCKEVWGRRQSKTKMKLRLCSFLNKYR